MAKDNHTFNISNPFAQTNSDVARTALSEAIRVSQGAVGYSPEEIIVTAKKFYNFLSNPEN